MAAKSQHVHDSCVVERRLRPIYDWLDVGNNKKALQEIEKVLKKSPSLQCARALRCLATWRLGREREALGGLGALAADLPADDATLQVMTICYRESQQLDKVCQMYEAAVKKDPQNEELHTHLFMSYVRVGALERQQHAAMQLFRHKPKNPYYFWAVMSIVLQATRGTGSTDPIRRGVLLELAQRMVDRLGEEGLQAEQELRLYLHVLELRGMQTRALELLAGPLAARLLPGAWPAAALPLLRQILAWRRLNRLAKGLLRESPDRWDYYLVYLDSAFRLMAGEGEEGDTPGEGEEQADDSPALCAAFLRSCGADNKKPLRGPQLALLEFYQRLKAQDKNPQGLLGDATDLLLQYFRVFGGKPCCVSDLRPYLPLGSDLPHLLLDLELTPPGENDAALLQRRVSLAQLCSCCGGPTPSLPDLACAPLEAHKRWAESLATKSSAPLLQGLKDLRVALLACPTDYHCKLLAMKFYHTLGCGWGAHSLHEELDVKHVQLDSLCHLHHSQLARSGLLAMAKEIYIQTVKFFTSSYKDSVDHLTFSYKFGTFMKLNELMDWRERLHNSLYHAWCSVEGTHLALLGASTPSQACTLLLAAPAPPEFHLLTDNRDLHVSAHWDAPTPRDETAGEEQFRQELTYLKIRSLLIEGLRATTTPGSTISIRDQLAQLLKEERDRAPQAVRPHSAAGPLPSRLLSLVRGPALDACLAGLSCIGAPALEEPCAVLVQEYYSKTLAAVERQATAVDPLWTHRETMEEVVNFLEVISFLCVICGQSGDTTRGPKGKGARKPTGPLTGALQEAVTGLAPALASWVLPAQLEALGLAREEQPLCPLAGGHVKASACLAQALKDKAKYLAGLA